ncbi:uncharacterized protein LOC124937078 [Impatiens glandulifera]|uniref:uncharacterized protein LOC124937078 n=1 Tax=Impatiens glandulifera TaxID=253017 RepID=UPI001FB173E6|nr:uncharacterized protein LOC124937078 [Impatiens glandulifera]
MDSSSTLNLNIWKDTTTPRSLYSNRPRFSTFSLHSSSSSYSTASAVYNTSTINTARKAITRSLQIKGHSNNNDSDNPTLFKLKPIRNLKSSSGYRSFWRRILFGSNKFRSVILLNLVTVIYASNISVVKDVETITDPAAFTVVRFVISAIPFIPFAFKTWEDIPTRNAGIELGCWISLGYLMQAFGLLTSDAGRASFLSMMTVIVVPILDGMLGAIIPSRTWFGVLMSVLGITMLESSGSPPSVGDLLNFLSAIFFGIHILRTEHISRQTNRDKFLHLLSYEVCVIAIFSTFSYLIGAWFGGGFEESSSPLTWTLIWDWMEAFPWIPALYTGVFSTVLCLWVEMSAMRDVSATETAIIYGLEPVWGAGFAWFLLGERWGVTGWIGAAFVLGGSLMVQLHGSSTPASSSLPFQDSDSKQKENHSLVSNKQIPSPLRQPIVVTPRRDETDPFKK